MASTVRWLLLPIIFVCFQWSLLLSPSQVLHSTPTLWTTAAENASLALKLPYTRVQAFQLGWHAALYTSCLASAGPSKNCTTHVDATNAVLSPNSYLTPKQLNSAMEACDIDRSGAASLSEVDIMLRAAANTHGMKLTRGQGDEGEAANTVLVYDSTRFPFHLGEPYHQFHSNFFQSAGMVGGSYPASYTTDLWAVQKDIGKLPSTGCPDGRHY